MKATRYATFLSLVCPAKINSAQWHFEDKSVVTVWSAPNYCYRCGNVASIMNLGADLEPKFTIFSAVSERDRHVPPTTNRRTEYFL